MMNKRVLLSALTLLLASVMLAASPVRPSMLGPVLMLQMDDGFQLSEENLSFGMDSRFRIGPVPSSVLVFFCHDYCDQNQSGIRINSYAAVGAAADLSRLTLGVYAGPKLGYFIQSGKLKSFDTALSMRITGDVRMMDSVFVGISYLMDGKTSLQDLDAESLLSFFDDHIGRFTLSFLVPMR